MYYFLKKKVIKNYSYLMLFILCFAGCAKHSPKPLNIPKVTPQEKNGLVVRTMLLNNKTWKDEFNFNASPQKYGYQPIQIAIGNNTTHTYTLTTNAISLPLTSPKKVLTKMTRKTRFLNATGMALLGVCFIPFAPACAIGWGIGSYLGLIITPVQLDGSLKMITMNRSETFDIEPNNIFNRIMFIKTCHYTPTFQLPLLNKETGIIENFTIKLNT